MDRAYGIRPGILVWSLIVFMMVTASMSALAQPPIAPGGGPRRLAVLLFINGTSPADLPAPVGEVRVAARDALEETVNKLALGIVPRSVLVPMLEKWRVRSSYGFGAPFIEDLSERTEANYLMVTTLLVAPDRLQLLVRITDIRSGILIHADALEQPLDTWTSIRTQIDSDVWFARLDALCRSLDWPGPRPVDLQMPLLLIPPTRGVACDLELAATASHCLLGPIVASGQWRVPDPALLAAELRSVGIRLDRIDATGRRKLGQTYGSAPLLQSELVVFGIPTPRGVSARFENDDIPRVANRIDEYGLAVSVITSSSGVIFGTRTDHRTHGLETGWFGNVKSPSLLQRFHTSAHELWPDVIALLEDK